MKIRGVFVTGRAILSNPENLLSLVDLTEVLTYVGIPEEVPDDANVYANLTFVALHEATTDEEPNAGPVPAKFWIETPKGRRTERSVELDFMGSKRSRVLLQLTTLPYAGAGDYAFCLESPAGVAKWEVEVLNAQPQNVEPNQTEIRLINL